MISVEIEGWRRLQAWLEREFPAKADRFIQQALHEVGEVVKAEAKKRALISPTKSQYIQTLVHKRSKQTRFSPGGLERSIHFDAVRAKGCVDIFVPSNSDAAKYAYRMHEERGKTWHNLGPGSRAKQSGARVGERFISRAYEENKKQVSGVFEKKIKALADSEKGKR